jgi:hypothetical protein
MTGTDLFLMLDAWMIAPFRWASPAEAGFILGTFTAAVQSDLLGRLCLHLMNRVQRHLRETCDREVEIRQNLSLKAIQSQDKTAYLAQNDLAQEAYGKSMALAVGRFCARFWPAVMVLAWMKSRFSDTPLSISIDVINTSLTLAYPVVFISLSIFIGYFFRLSMKYVPRNNDPSK